MSNDSAVITTSTLFQCVKFCLLDYHKKIRLFAVGYKRTSINYFTGGKKKEK